MEQPNDTITVPRLAEIEARIRDCRQELAALRKLHRLATTIEQAQQAHTRRTNAEKEGIDAK